MKSRTAEKNGRKRIGNAYIVTLSVLFLLIAVGVFRSGILPLRSVEVAFSDIAPDGLAIVPASCASTAPPYSQTVTIGTSTAYLGYKVPPGTNQADVYVSSIPLEFCITNTSSNTYFFPANTAVEAMAFINAFSRLSGLSSTATGIGTIGDYKVDCTAGTVTGWADFNYLTYTTLAEGIDIYVDLVGSTYADSAYPTANVDMPGLGAAAGIGAGNDDHGFTWTIPAQFLNGVEHTLSVYGATGNPVEYISGPTNFTCGT